MKLYISRFAWPELEAVPRTSADTADTQKY